MRLRRERSGSGTTVSALVDGDRWVPLAEAASRAGRGDPREVLGAAPDDLVGLLAGGGRTLDRIRELCLAVTGELPAAQVLPLLEPASLRCFSGWQEHWESAARTMARRYHPAAPWSGWVVAGYEALTRRTFPALRPRPEFFDNPVYYTGNHLTVLSDGDTVPWPGYCRDLDFELEIGALVVRPLLDADERAAQDAVGGFVVFNDWSARDTQWTEHTRGPFGPVVKTKTFASSMSAELVTADEVWPVLGDLAAAVHVDGEPWSRTSTAGLRWSVPQMLAHASRGEAVRPGELVVTGTLPGGSGLELDRWVAAGQRVTLEVDRIGRLTNLVGPRPTAAAR